MLQLMSLHMFFAHFTTLYIFLSFLIFKNAVYEVFLYIFHPASPYC